MSRLCWRLRERRDACDNFLDSQQLTIWRWKNRTHQKLKKHPIWSFLNQLEIKSIFLNYIWYNCRASHTGVMLVVLELLMHTRYDILYTAVCNYLTTHLFVALWCTLKNVKPLIFRPFLPFGKQNTANIDNFGALEIKKHTIFLCQWGAKSTIFAYFEISL